MIVGMKLKFTYIDAKGTLKTYVGNYIPSMQPSSIKNLDAYIRTLSKRLKIQKIIGEIEKENLTDRDMKEFLTM